MSAGLDVGPIMGESPSVREVRRLVATYATSRLPVLLVGATGTGKELVAHHIHQRSGRSGPWVPVNCAALPRAMAESLLFGHRRGAYSGAVETRVGHVARAHRGSLFLDELLDLPNEVQPTLLRALDTGEVQPLGEATLEHVDLRVISAVRDDVWAQIADGTFRQDLLQRIAGVVIALAPLARRTEDLPLLAAHFAALQGQRLAPGAEVVLTAHPWPGNVRELRLTIARACHLVPDGVLSGEAIAEAIALGAPHGHQATSPGHGPGREQLMALLDAVGWDTAAAACALGVHRATIYRRMRDLSIAPSRRRAAGTMFVRANSREFVENPTSATPVTTPQPLVPHGLANQAQTARFVPWTSTSPQR